MLKKVLAVVLCQTLIICAAVPCVRAASAAVFSLNRISEDDGFITVGVALDSGSFNATDIEVRAISENVKECVSIEETEGFLNYCLEARKNGVDVLSAGYEETCKFSCALTPGDYALSGENIVNFTFRKASASPVKSGDLALVINSVNNTEGNTTAETVNNLDRLLLIFDAAGGNCSVKYKALKTGDRFGVLPAASKTGYTFSGWYTQPAGGTKVTSGTVIKENVTVYAHYSPRTYTLTFDANGGNCDTASRKITYGGRYGTLPAAEKKYCDFYGWYTEPAGGTKVDADTLITEDTTVYARYSGKKYIVTLDANGGSVSETSFTVSDGDRYGKLPDPVRDGYKFDGWYTAKNDGEKVSALDKPSDNVTLFAHWTYQKSLVVFDAAGGDGTVSREVNNGTKLGTLPTASRKGYTFDGWYTAKVGGNKISSATVVKNDVTYYAHWSIIMGDVTLDGRIDSSDALSILQHSVGQINLKGELFERADVNRDGRVDSSDALSILQYSIGKISHF